MRISKFTLFFSIYIILSSFFMQDVWTTWKMLFGKKFLTLFFILLCSWGILAILYRNIKSHLNIKRIVLNCVLCVWGLIFALRQPYFPEKAHVLEFGILAWLVMRDLTKKSKLHLKDVFIAFVFVAMVGVLEEGYQKILPWRVFEVRDIISDILSGMLGIVLSINSQPKIKSRLQLS